MSGGNCPETPRQKMVGMMYLMLTAMLALNVSGDVLNAFTIVTQNIKRTTIATESKTSLIMQKFESQNAMNPQKAGQKYRKALEVTQRANELYNLIEEYKQLMVSIADGEGYTPDNYKSINDQDVAAQVMIVEQNGARGKKLKEDIEKYRNYLKDILEGNEMQQKNIEMALEIVDPKMIDGVNVSWQSQNFEHIPLASTMSLMSKMQSDVRNTEADVINYLYDQIDAKSFKFNKVEPLIISQSNIVLRGEEYKAEIMLAAYDTTTAPIISVGSEKLHIANGKGIYSARSKRVGEMQYTARLQIPDPETGGLRDYEVMGQYEVVEPMAVVSPTMMNVAYLGIENPVSISAAGIPQSSLKVEATGGTITRNGTEYTVVPHPSAKTVEIHVSALVNGRTRKIKTQSLRVVRLPDPVVKVGGKKGGSISKSQLMAALGLVAEMENFYADNIRYQIRSFKIISTKGDFTTFMESNSARFTAAQKAFIDQLRRGDKLIIEDISIHGPDGNRMLDGALSFTVK